MDKQPKRIHLICNAHIDPVWLWDRTEGIGAAISTFRTAVRFCKEDNGLIFNHNEAVLYQYIQEYDPALFAEIKQLVALGRWHLMGGWYVQPDCNMPSGEAFVRQISEGRRFFREQLGYDNFRTAINFDPFGHTVGLVQILAKTGYDSYIVVRPSEHMDYIDGNPQDKMIDWRGFCNSRIYIFKAHRYNNLMGDVMQTIREFETSQADKQVIAALWGVGDHGGGPSEVDLKALQQHMDTGADRVFHSTPEAYFADYFTCEKPDYVLDCHSLRSFSVGCYTSMTRIKQANRQLENRLLVAEKLNSTVAANGLGRQYPAGRIQEAWKDLLFWQFHDSLPGSSIQKVENDALCGLYHGLDTLNHLCNSAFFACCGGQKPAADGELPVLVYNPHPYELETPVECEYMLADQNWTPGAFTFGDVYDEEGRKLPCQNEKESSNVPLDWAKKVTFLARLAPMSISRFNIRNRCVKDYRVQRAAGKDGFFRFDNGCMQAVISLTTGLLESYRVDGTEFLSAPAARLLVVNDNCDPWGMTVSGFRDVLGAFRLATPQETARHCAVARPAIDPVRVVEDGEVRTVIEAAFVYGASELCLRYYLPKKGSQIRLNLRVFSMERDRMLKLSFPTVLSDGRYTARTAYGRDELAADGREVVGQGWTMLSDAERAFAVINTGTYGSDCVDGEIRMSVLRTAGYSAHPLGDREILPADRLSARIDIGERLFDYVIEAGEATAVSDRIDYECQLVHQPPLALSYAPSSEGVRPEPLCVIRDRRLELVTVKQAADGNGFIIRLFNTAEQPLTAEISFPAWRQQYTVTAEKFEIVSLRRAEDGVIAPAGLLD